MGFREILQKIFKDYYTYIHLIQVPLTYLLGQKKGAELREKLMADYFDTCSPGRQPFLHKLKEKAYGDLKKKKPDHSNRIRILEIGAGAGTNFVYYPENTELTVTDPNAAFHEIVTQTALKFPGIKLKAVYACPAEDMSAIETSSMDAILTSDVLCSVKDIRKVLQEIHRILKPNGVYYFAEHCLDHQPSWLRSVQNFLTYTGLWPFYFCGCEFRDFNKLFESKENGTFYVMAECGYNGRPESQNWLDYDLCSPYYFGKAIVQKHTPK